MAEEEAELEIARRYFENYGPCTNDDARYYFKRRKDLILNGWNSSLETITVEGQERFGFNLDVDYGDLPNLLLLSGFDPLLMGYEKTEILSEEEHMREVLPIRAWCDPASCRWPHCRHLASNRAENSMNLLLPDRES